MLNVIKAIALDVDGVLTDGTFCWGPDGQESKRFSFRDVMGISQASKAGVIFALISGENSPLVDRFGEKVGIDPQNIFKGCRNKDEALRKFATNRGLELGEIAFMGDDINDLAAMRLAGCCAAPADAHLQVRQIARFVCHSGGGQGAVREFIDHLVSLNHIQCQQTHV